MGLHSTLFGPVKFAYLPQHLNERELTGGNGMVEMGTFVAILLGQRRRRPAGRRSRRRAALGRRSPACGVALLGRTDGAGDAARRPPPTRACASTGIRSARPGATSSSRTATSSSSARCWASRGCGSSAPSSCASSRRSPRKCCTATSRSRRCCWWCSRSASASARCCARCCRAARSRSAWCRSGAIGMSVFAIDLYFAVARPAAVGGLRARGRSSREHGALARDGRPRPAVAVRRPLQRADVRADPDALASRATARGSSRPTTSSMRCS